MLIDFIKDAKSGALIVSYIAKSIHNSYVRQLVHIKKIASMGNIIDKYLLGSRSSVRTLLIMFYLSNEGISIMENAGLIGIPIPQKLKAILQQLNKDNSTEDD